MPIKEQPLFTGLEQPNKENGGQAKEPIVVTSPTPTTAPQILKGDVEKIVKEFGGTGGETPASGTKLYSHTITFKDDEEIEHSVKVISTYGQAYTKTTLFNDNTAYIPNQRIDQNSFPFAFGDGSIYVLLNDVISSFEFFSLESDTITQL